MSDRSAPLGPAPLPPGTPLGALLGELPGRAAGAATGTAPVGSGGEPFLTVVVRTGGTRPATLDDLLLALAAQTCDAFEVVVTASGPPAAAAASAAVEAFEASFRGRVRVLGTPAGGQPAGAGAAASAASRGVAAARGRYVAVLDDDQVPFGHWVELLRGAAGGRPGAVVRLAVATQQVVATPGRWRRAEAVSRAARADGGAVAVDAYDVTARPAVRQAPAADLLDLLAAAPEPVCGFAVPRYAFADLGVRFDPALGADADWLAVLRAVQWCGLHTVDEVGLLRRVWRDGASDGTAPGGAPLAERRARVLAALDAEALLLDRHSASRLAALHAAAAGACGPGTGGEPAEPGVAADEHAAQLLAVQAACEDAEARLAAVHASTSWRVTAPLRAAADWWRRR